MHVAINLVVLTTGSILLIAEAESFLSFKNQILPMDFWKD